MLMRAATVVQVLQDVVLYFIACFILLVIAPLAVTDHSGMLCSACSSCLCLSPSLLREDRACVYVCRVGIHCCLICSSGALVYGFGSVCITRRPGVYWFSVVTRGYCGGIQGIGSHASRRGWPRINGAATLQKLGVPNVRLSFLSL